MVFTGDTLFSGSVGRTDLLGKPSQSNQAEKLYFSLHDKVLTLGDGLLVYPAHGAGSVCGHGISGQEPTTIGYEKKNNPYLKLSKEEFIQNCLSDEFIVPKYFRKMEEYNLNGAPLLTQSSLPIPLPLSDFEKQVENPSVLVMDTRSPYAYAGSHIRHCLNIWLGGTSVYPGWLLDISQNIVFVNERPEDIETLTRRLIRLGFDNLRGYLCGGMNHWQEAGKPLSSTRTLQVVELKSKLENQEVALLDVREPIEWKEDGYVEGANLVFFADLPESINSLPKNKPIAVTCSVGNRSSTAISILERAGVKDTFNVLGGITAWSALNLPLKR
jgi:hydroxyacylglutathione hydrolase